MRRLTLIFIFALLSSALCRANSYSTAFTATENPISEGGRWICGQAAGSNLWGNMQTTPGQAFASTIPTAFGDATCNLTTSGTGAWSSTQYVRVPIKVNVVQGSSVYESELRLRSTISSGSITGYEVLCPVHSSPGYGIQIVRWNGANGDFVQIGTGAVHQCVNGEVMDAWITGTTQPTITVRLNGTIVATACDNGQSAGGGHSCGGFTYDGGGGLGSAAGPWTTGNPGMGVNDGGNNHFSDFGLSAFYAADDATLPWLTTLSAARAIDWSGAGLPPTITYGSGGAACDGAHANCVETNPNPWTPAPRVLCGSSLPAGSSAATINAAAASCLPGSYVAVSGTSSITTDLILRTNGVSLRGDGGSSTVLNMASGADVQFGVCCGNSTGLISGTPPATATSVVLTGATGNPASNQPVDINQCDFHWTGSGLNGSDSSCTSGSNLDPGTIWPCGLDDPVCSQNSTPGGTHNYQHQIVLVTSVVGSCATACVVNFTPPLYMPNWGTTNNARMIWQTPANHSFGVGLEDLTLNFTFNAPGKISTQSAYAYRLIGLRVIGEGATDTRLTVGDHSAQGLVKNNYLFGENQSAFISPASEPLLRAHDTSSLLLNNIVTGGMCLWGNGRMVGEVIAYDYCRDSQSPDNQSLSLNHNPFESLGLLEGNVSPQIHSDATHGTNALMTYFRNYSSGYDSPYITTHPRSYLLGVYNRMNNYIGNALGGILTTTYQGTDDNGKEYVIPTEALTAASFMRWGNCDVVTATCRNLASEVPNSTNMPSGTFPNAVAFQNPTPVGTALPPSYFMPGIAAHPSGGTGLSWWKVCTNWSTFPLSCASSQVPPFPPVGPDVSGGLYVNGHAYDNPATLAYKFSPIDTARQNLLTITASTWSNNATICQIVALAGGITTATAPCEILTVSTASLASAPEHIMGGFQLSGVSVACIPAGINFANPYGNNEILMTGSTLSQVAYSLSADPGANACVGTFKFPNIRFFDERIYQTDTGGSAPNVLLSPTSLTFTALNVGVTSASQPVTLTNNGTATLTISSITATGDFAQSNNCGATLAISTSCTINVTFTPTNAGSRTGSISIVDNAAGSPHLVALTGVGLAPTVYRPTTFTDSSGIPTANSPFAYDGNFATSSIMSADSGDAIDIVYFGIPALIGSTPTATLFVQSTAILSGSGIKSALAQYSLDAGAHWNALWFTTTGRPATLDSVVLSTLQDFTQVQVQFLGSCAVSGCATTIFGTEIWIQTVGAQSGFSGGNLIQGSVIQ